MTTLGLLLFVTLIVVTVLSMSANTSTLVQRQSEDAHELRAADGAISAAVAYLRDTPPDEVHGEAPCDDALGTPIDVDDLSVRVVCEELEGSGEVVPIGDSGQITVLGLGTYAIDNYWGTVPWTTKCPGTTTASTCFPWGPAIGPGSGPWGDYLMVGGRPNGPHPSMVYSGSSALKIGGDLQLKAGSIGVRDPASLGVAMSVSGDYVQGNFGNGNAYGPTCGLLEGPGNDAYLATRIVTGGTRTCKDTSAANLSADDMAIDPAVEWTPTLLRVFEKTLGPCPATTLVKLEPGAYNASETAKLNKWLSEGDEGSGDCVDDVKTFYFAPGPYWFDVNDPSQPSGDPRRDSLHFNNSKASVVFGEPKDWTTTNDDGATAERFPEACNPKAEGVSIALSARTTIRHDKGRVAICGPSAGTPAIWQDDAPGETDAVLTPGTDTSSDLDDDPGIARSNDWRCPFFGSQWWNPLSWPRAACERDVRVTYSGFDDDADATTDPGPGPINSAVIRVVGEHRYANDGPAYTQFDVTVPTVQDIAGTDIPGFSCRARYSRIPQSTSEPIAYDLLARPAAQSGDTGATENNCWDRFTDRAQLRAATVVATFHLKTHPRVLYNDKENTESCLYASFDGCTYEFSIEELEILQGRIFTPTQSALEGGSWSNPSNVLNWPGAASATGNGSRSIEVSGFTNPYDPPLPTETLDQVGLLVTSQSDYGNGSGAETKVTVRDSSGTDICGARFPRIGSNGHTRYLDLMTTDTSQAQNLDSLSRCSTILDPETPIPVSPEIFDGAKIEIEINPTCSSVVPGIVCGWGFVNHRIDMTHVSLMSVSNSGYLAPKQGFQVTMNDDPLDAADALFHVFGRVSLPNTALDIRWTGDAPRNAVVEGDLVVGSIGSFGIGDHQVGVLCCGPVRLKDRKVQLRAIVDVPDEGERLRSVATARIDDEDEDEGVYSAGYGVAIEAYRICNTSDLTNAAGCGPATG